MRPGVGRVLGSPAASSGENAIMRDGGDGGAHRFGQFDHEGRTAATLAERAGLSVRAITHNSGTRPGWAPRGPAGTGWAWGHGLTGQWPGCCRRGGGGDGGDTINLSKY